MLLNLWTDTRYFKIFLEELLKVFSSEDPYYLVQNQCLQSSNFDSFARVHTF